MKKDKDEDQEGRTKKLVTLLAKEIENVVELFKENQLLKSELAKTKNQRDMWQKYYKELKGDKKILCNRDKAMIEHGEVDMNEIWGNKE